MLAGTTGPWVGRWAPGIGDPSLGGWLTVACYLLGAWACREAARAAGRCSMPRRERRFWMLLALLLLLLGANKQLDLQSALTEFGRLLARAHGWYGQRALVQLWFIVAAGVAAMALAGAVLYLLRRAPKPTQLAIMGAGALLGFVLIRAASFHHMDRFVGSMLLGLRANWLLEIGGILLVAAGALWRRDASRPAAPATDRAV